MDCKYIMEKPQLGFGPDTYRNMKGYRKKFDNIPNKIISKINNAMIEHNYVNIISEAIRMGYRLIDYSASYGDGTDLAKAISKSGIEREKLFITTRISNQAQLNNYVEKEFFAQLKGLNTEYVDVLMLHWPVSDYYIETWMKMIDFKEKGLCKSIGVANCSIHHLEEIYEKTGIYPEVNQVEIHPLFSQNEMRDFCRDKGIRLEAYSPTARHDDRLYNPKLLKNMSEKYGKDITQIILRWHIQKGESPIIRSLNKEHLRSNLDIFSFELSEDDVRLIDGLNINSRMRYDPDNCDFTSL